MGQKQRTSSDGENEVKKRRRVGFSSVDDGVEAKDCITIYLVSSKEEFDAPENFVIHPVDLNSFFNDDGKICGYEGLKITIGVSSISFVRMRILHLKVHLIEAKNKHLREC